MSSIASHTPVLLHEAVDSLIGQTSGCYVDGTFGRGGHSRAILQRLDANGQLIAFDKDPQAVAHAHSVIEDVRFHIHHDSFVAIEQLPPASADGVLLDLGVSSPQIDTPERGFSFQHDGPLDMRMNTTCGESVADWLAYASAETIAEVIRDYGEERFAQPIAKAIVARRQEHGAITRTAELSQLVAGAVKTREPGQNPATRTFQAFRIFINAELKELSQALAAALRVLKPLGCLAVISFHSLEDRIVKQFMQQHAREQIDRRQPTMLPQQQAVMPLRDLRRVRPSQAEIQTNPRARSAILRVATRAVSAEVAA